MDKEAAKNILFELKENLDALGVEFFLNYGTCLSAYRGDFCEGDEDLDLGVKHETFVPKIKLLIKILVSRGFKIMIHSNPFIYPRALKIQKNNINTDIIDYAIHGEERFHVHYKDDHARVHTASLFENMSTVTFLGKEFLVPRPVEYFLAEVYGESWKTPNPNFKFSDYTNFVPKYWQRTKLSKSSTMLSKRIRAAWEVYKIESGINFHV